MDNSASIKFVDGSLHPELIPPLFVSPRLTDRNLESQQEEHPGDNPEIIEKQKSQPMDENGDGPSKEPEEAKMHRKESMDERRRSRSNSS